MAKYKHGRLKSPNRAKHLKKLSGLKYMSRVCINDVVPSGDFMNVADDNNIPADNNNISADDNGRPWFSERRVVELSVLAEGLQKCNDCPSPLHIKDIVKETKMGLGSLFHIQCEMCTCINVIASGKRHSCITISDSGDSINKHARANVFDVNTKLAAGM